MPAPSPPLPASGAVAAGQPRTQSLKARIPAAAPLVPLPVTSTPSSVRFPAFSMPPPLPPFSAGHAVFSAGVHDPCEVIPPETVTPLIVTTARMSSVNTAWAPPPSMSVLAAPAPTISAGRSSSNVSGITYLPAGSLIVVVPDRGVVEQSLAGLPSE